MDYGIQAQNSHGIFRPLHIDALFILFPSNNLLKTLSPQRNRPRCEKLTHLNFYFHDIVSGPNPTAIRVVQATVTDKSSTGLGAVVKIDDPLTITPDNMSKIVGRAQRIYALSFQEEAELLMVFNFAFCEGKYIGSNLSLLGHNTVFSKVREMHIVNGTGVFHFARSYAHARTHLFNLLTGDAIVEYNVYVTHY